METSSRSFTSWKMDWINAMMVGLDHREFHVAVCLLQFANQKTKLIFPSQARVAALLGCSERGVRRAIADLVRTGWIEAARVNRHMSNSYRFVERKRDEMTDLRLHRDEAFLGERWSSDRTDVSSPDRTEVSSLEGAEVSSKHLEITPPVEHLHSGHERRGSFTSVSEALKSTPIFRSAVDPKSSLDHLERSLKNRGAA